MGYLKLRNKLYDLSKPLVMGIMNATPDSFYEGNRSNDENIITGLVARMVESGADIIDVGGYSSRPGATDIGERVEVQRVSKALSAIRLKFPDILISVDTFRSRVARMAVSEYGADIINDITAGDGDSDMMGTIAELDVPYIMMHMQGNPSNMQDNPQYNDVVNDIIIWFSKKIDRFREAGIKDIIIDPGFGFGKTTGHNYELLNSFERFSILGCPVMAGLSRKSMIWKVLECRPEDPGSLTGTTVLNTVALLKGASIIRVHDTEEAVHAVKLLQSLRGIQ